LLVKVDPNQTTTIDRIFTKANTCYAICDNGETYLWGDLSHGLSLEAGFHQSDLPVRSKRLEAFNFSDIALTEDSAVAIGSSVLLTFTFPEAASDKPSIINLEVESDASSSNS
jgi:hypothetical protein